MKTRSIGSLSASSIGLGGNNAGFVPGLPAAPIYRYVGEPAFARDFQMGKIRISTLRRCRTIEDTVRRDAGEGNRTHNTRTVVGDGNLELNFDFQSQVTVEHAFVLCFTQRDDDFSRGHFGRCGVEISEPMRLFADLTRAIHARGFNVVWSTASKVYYHERTFVGGDRPPALTELVKPPAFAEEREVRFVWRLLADPGTEWLHLELPEGPSGCRVLDD